MGYAPGKRPERNRRTLPSAQRNLPRKRRACPRFPSPVSRFSPASPAPFPHFQRISRVLDYACHMARNGPLKNLPMSVDLADYLPAGVRLPQNPQLAIPELARNPEACRLIEKAAQSVPTSHRLHRADARAFALPPNSVHLVLTSPPYWTLKEYRDSPGQLGHISSYDSFLASLDRVWQVCYDALVAGDVLFAL